MKNKWRAFFLIVALLGLLAGTSFSATVTWSGGGDGTSWSDAANWTSGTLPGASDDVVIGTVAGSPTVQLNGAAGTVQVHSLSTSLPLSISGGVLQVDTAVQASGAIALSGGATIKGGIWPKVTVSGTATMDGVTLNGDVTTSANVVLQVKNGLTLNNGKVTVASSGTVACTVVFLGTQTLGGTGELFFAGNGGTNYVKVQGVDDTAGGGATLTIGSNITVHGTYYGNIQTVRAYDALINLGTIVVDTTSKGISITGIGSGTSTFENQGVVNAGVGSIALRNWNIKNNGTVTSPSVGTLSVEISTISGIWPAMTISGVSMLSGVTLGGDVNINNNGAAVTTMDGAILNGNVTTSANVVLQVKNGLTLNNGKVTVASSGTVASTVVFLGTQTLGGAGELCFGGNGGTNYVKVQGADDTVGGGATLTIGGNITVHGTYYGNIQTVRAYDALINLGTIVVDTASKGISIAGIGSGTSTFENRGIVNAGVGSIALTNWSVDNNGTVASPSVAALSVQNSIIGGVWPAMTISGITMLPGVKLNGEVNINNNAASVTTLDGAVLNGNVTTSANVVLQVKNGLTLNNAKLTVASSGTVASTLLFLGTQTLGGTGELRFGGDGGTDYVKVQGTDDTVGGGATLTIGANITVHGARYGIIQTVRAYDSIINLGTIIADTTGSGVSITGIGSGTSTLENRGIIKATLGNLTFTSVAVNNIGVFTKTGTGNVNFSGVSFTGGNLPSIALQAGQTTTISGLTVDSDLQVPNGATLIVKNGLVLNNARIILLPTSSTTSLRFQGTQSVTGKGGIVFGGTSASAGQVIIEGADNTVAGGATLTIGAKVAVDGAQSGTLKGIHTYDSLVNLGTIAANASGTTLSVTGLASLQSGGNLSALNGGNLTLSVPVSITGEGAISTTAGSTFSLGANFLGDTTAVVTSNLQGVVAVTGASSSGAPRLIETMSKDSGANAIGFANNFALGAVVLPANSYVRLVDQSDNVPGTGAQALYAQALFVPSSSTVDLNGLHLYTKGAQIAGTVLNGTVTQLPSDGILSLNQPVPGSIAAAGNVSEWTLFERGGRALSISVNPGTGGSPAPIAPQLQWVRVQLLDPSGNVLGSAESASAGAMAKLSSVPIPVDGIYKIRVSAANGHASATGYYVLNGWDAAPSVFALNLGQQTTGKIVTPTGVDQWNFSAMAGQQVRLQGTGNSKSGIAFSLTGPEGYVAFQGRTGDSPLIDLPASGSYTLSVYGLNGATGGYSFNLVQTSIAPLELGTPYTGTWAGSGQARLFTIAMDTANPLMVTLSDSSTRNHSELYVRYGAPPTREISDHADTTSGGNHSLLIPKAAAGIWYVLVYGESIPTGSGSFTLKAVSNEVLVTQTTTKDGASNQNTVINLNGAGFGNGVIVSLKAADGTVYSATTTSVLSPTNLTASFAPGLVPPGAYTVLVSTPSGATSILPAPFIFTAQGVGVLSAHLEVPNPVGRHAAATLYIDYTNTGNGPMPAPMLILSARNPAGLQGAYFTLDASLRNSGFWTSAMPAGFSNSVQVLASGANPGVLQPGETGRVPVYYAGWNQAQWDFNHPTLNFSLTSIEADDTTYVDWASKEASLRPATVSAEAWHVMYAALLPRLGGSAGGYVKLLDDAALYLGQLPAKVPTSALAPPVMAIPVATGGTGSKAISDIGKLWGFVVAQVENLWPVPSLSSTTDGSLPTPGSLPMTFSRAFNNTIPGRYQAGLLGRGWFTPWQQHLSIATDGTLTLVNGSGSRSTYQPDSRHAGSYFSQPGDTSTFTSSGGKYLLTVPTGGVTTFNSDGTLASVEDKNGNKITAAYGSGKLLTLTASTGQSFVLNYNSAGLLSTLGDSAGRTTHYAYDAANQYLLSVTSYNGQVTSYTYDTTSGSPAVNALTSVALPDGTRQYFGYDNGGRLASTSVDGGALAKTFTHSEGQVNITDALGNTSSLFFNENGQLAKTVDALGHPTLYAYDANYNLACVTNAAGASAWYGYNAVGNVTDSRDFLGNHTRFASDAPFNQLSTLTDANGNVTQYAYNATGNLLKTTYANGRFATSTYDSHGNALSFVNPAQEAIAFTHNAGGQITTATFPDGSSYSYTYDGEGHLVAATDVNGSVVFTYHPVTRLLTKMEYPNGLLLIFTYDSAGRRTSITDQTGFTTNYAYDTLGRLSTLKNTEGQTLVTYFYDAAGRLSRKNNGNGTYTTYDYDSNGHVLHLINYAPNGAINSRFDDTYNALGLKTAEATLDGTWTYTYDANGQLTHAIFASTNPAIVPNQDLVYNYDPMGNRTSTVINGVTTEYVVNNMNQYSSVAGVAYSYDVKGDLLSDGMSTYTYNISNAVNSITSSSGVVKYMYNPMGQRIGVDGFGQAARYLIDPFSPGCSVGAFDKNNNAAWHCIFGLGLAAVTSAGETLTCDLDASGSVVGEVNYLGSCINRYSYLPFGEMQPTNTVNRNIFKFMGALGVVDALDGCLLTPLRVYSKNLGRFTSVDPFQLAGGDPNFYRYASNNPANLVDPSGAASIPYVEILNSIRLGYLTGAPFWAFLNPYKIIKGGAFDMIVDPVEANVAEDQEQQFLHDYGRFPNSDDWKKFNDKGSFPVYPPNEFYPNHQNPALRYIDFPSIPGGNSNYATSTNTVGAVDPNALYGPAGYGVANFVSNFDGSLAYQIAFENDAAATAPAQSVTVSNYLDAQLDWSTFQLNGIGFGDNNFVIPAGSQHYQTTVSMAYNDETFDVQIEAGIHTDTGEVYAIFQSINPATSLPPESVLTGFLPPEDGTGRGQGYLTYSVSAKTSLATGAVIANVASIVFDAGEPITTDQVDPHDASKGTDPAKQARVTIDAMAPTSHVEMLPEMSPSAFPIHWAGTDDAAGAGLSSYSIYYSDDNGANWKPWLLNTTATSGIFRGQPGTHYGFYSQARDHAGNTEIKTVADAITETLDGTLFQGNVVIAKNDPAPDVDQAKFLLAGSPAVDAAGKVTFRGVLAGTSKSADINSANNVGIWTYDQGDGSLVLQTGANPSFAPAATITALGDPAVSSDGSLALLATLKGDDVKPNKSNAIELWSVSSGATRLVARQGEPAADQQDATYAAFAQVVTQQPDRLAFQATLKGTGVKAASNIGLWATDLGDILHSVIRKSEPLLIGGTFRTVTGVTVFPTLPRERGQSRNIDTVNGQLAFRLAFGRDSALCLSTPAASGFTIESVASTWDATVPDVANTRFTAFDSPAVNSSGVVAYRATLASTSKNTKITAANAGGIWRRNGATTSLVARVGNEAPDTGGALFAKLDEPVLNNDGNIAFLGSLRPAKKLATAATDSGLWSDRTGSLALVVREGDPAAEVPGGKFASFSQLILPDGGGPIFLATLKGVPARAKTGLWSVGADNQPHLLVQTSNVVDVHGKKKTIKSLQVFQVCRQVSGQSRNFDASSRNVVFQATFTDGTWAILQIYAP